MGSIDRATTLYEEGLAIAREIGHPFARWLVPSTLAEALLQADEPERAASLLQESLAACLEMGHPWGHAQVLRLMGMVAYRQGKLNEADRLLQEACDVWTRLGSSRALCRVFVDVGRVAVARGDLATATRSFAESLVLARVPRDRRTAARCLVGLVTVTTLVDTVERSSAGDLGQLLGAIDAMLAGTRNQLPPNERPGWERALDEVRSRLSADAFETACARGRAMTFDQAIDLGLTVAKQIESMVRSTVGRESSKEQDAVVMLTPREREIAALVGRGYTNRRIAQALTIAEKTAEVHARNIREKLGLSTRAQIAAWAAQQGLLADDA